MGLSRWSGRQGLLGIAVAVAAHDFLIRTPCKTKLATTIVEQLGGGWQLSRKRYAEVTGVLVAAVVLVMAVLVALMLCLDVVVVVVVLVMLAMVLSVDVTVLMEVVAVVELVGNGDLASGLMGGGVAIADQYRWHYQRNRSLVIQATGWMLFMAVVLTAK